MMKKTVIEKSMAIILAMVLGGIPFPAAGLAEDLSPTPGLENANSAAVNQQIPAAGDSSGANGEAPRVKIERTPDGKFFLDFKGASLINVLNVLASLSGINFVAGKEVADRPVNMTLDNVTLEDTLQAIALGSNVTYEYLNGRNIYLFRASADAADQPVLMTKVFKFHYIRVVKPRDIETSSSSSSSSSTAGGSSTGGSNTSGLTTLQEEEEVDVESGSIFKIVSKMLSDRGKVSVDDRSNSIIVTDAESRLVMIEGAIKQLDRPLDQVLINVFLIETYEDLGRALGVRWGDDNGVFGTVYGGTENTSFPFITKAGAANNPANWFSQIANQFNPTSNTAPGVGPNASTATSGIRDFSAFQIRISAMEDANKVKVLAKPKILVLDNHAALIKIATNAAISQNTVTTGGGAGTVSDSIERAEVGTILRVTPLINSENRITMTVEPTFATVEDSAIAVTTPGTGVTGDTTVRQARTTLMVNDGQTIALGGLLFSNQSKENRKVPFFGNIPVVGKAFFTNNGKTLQDRELILFMTPFIIRDPSVLETPILPDKRLRFEEEKDPFWKIKSKEWYKNLKQDPERQIDYEQYFDVRKRLMDATLDTLDQKTISQETQSEAI